jgi:hypothetical protein
MAEPTAPRLRVTCTVKRADNGRFVIACDPLESESAPVIQGSDPTESEAVIAASDPTETEAVIRGSERDPTLISGPGGSEGRNFGQCIFLSNVVAAGKGGNPRSFSGSFSCIRQLEAKCLLLEKRPPPLSDITML